MRRLASSLVLGVSLCLVGSLAASAQTSQQPAHQGERMRECIRLLLENGKVEAGSNGGKGLSSLFWACWA